MIELLKKVQGMFKPAGENGKSQTSDPMEIIEESCRDLYTLAAQILSHAEKAPYPHVAERLRRIAAEKRSSADLLRDKLRNSAARLEPTLADIQSGKNHWERMAQDLNEHRALEARFLERAALLNEKDPKAAELLRNIAFSHRPHLEALLDLIARADPQAEQT